MKIYKRGYDSIAQMNTLRQIEYMTEKANVKKIATGNLKFLCILAEFSDRSFMKTKAEFEILMNQAGYSANGANGSVRDFYLKNSYGALNLQISVVGPVSLSNKTTYYAPDSRYRDFANEVINLADPLVDFSQFAIDGAVNGFHIIFAGYGDEAFGTGKQIWSHSGNLQKNGDVTKDGVKLSRYSCSPELRGNSGSNITYIGVIAHEIGHVLGAPDYYDVSANGKTYAIDYIGSGKWDLMASGSWNDEGRTPASINPYQKIQFGWVNAQHLVPGISITNMHASSLAPIVYKMTVNTNGEHYLFENRQKLGFDAFLPGHGLLVWHIASEVASYAPNDDHPLQVYPVCASSTTAIPKDDPLSYGIINSTGCPFPGTKGKTEFTDASVPRAFSWTNSGQINGLITNIVEKSNGTISFDVLCHPLEFINQNVSTNTFIQACDIYVKNVQVNNGAKLELLAIDEVDINGEFEVKAGAELNISSYDACTTCPINVGVIPTSVCRGTKFQVRADNATNYSIMVYSMSGALVYSSNAIISSNPVTLWDIPSSVATGYYKMQITFSSGNNTVSNLYTVLVTGC